MAFFNEFPYTRTYDSDLGWLIRHVGENIKNLDALQKWAAEHKEEYKELADKVEGLIEKLVDVIIPWDSSVAYHIFSIVEYQGTNYIAVQDVPVGAMITNTDYWRPANTVVEQINAIGLTVSELEGRTDDIEEDLNDVKEHVDIEKTIGLAFPHMNMSLDPNGLCSILYLGEHATLVDMGDYEAFTDIKTQLDLLGIRYIDAVFITHFHRDHSSINENASSGHEYDHWKNNYDMTNTVFYLPPNKGDYTDSAFRASFPNNTIVTMVNGNTYTWDEVKFTPYNIAAADYAYYDTLEFYYNNYCAIIYVQYGNSVYLCTGDAVGVAQTRCYARGYVKHADIVTAPHHGREQYSDTNFAETVSPLYVYIPAGTESDNQGLRDAIISIGAETATIFSNQVNEGIVNFAIGKASISASGTPIVVSQYSTEARNVIYVDENYTGVDSDGTVNKPYRKIRRAISACKGSSIIHLLSDISQTTILSGCNGYITIEAENHKITDTLTIRDGANVFIHNLGGSAYVNIYDSKVYAESCTFSNRVRFERSTFNCYECTWSGSGYTQCLFPQYSELYLYNPTVEANTGATSLISGSDSTIFGLITLGSLNGVRAIKNRRGYVQLGRLVDTANALNTMFPSALDKPVFMFDMTNRQLVVTANDGTEYRITADT